MANSSLHFLVISRVIIVTVFFIFILSAIAYIQLGQTLLILQNRTIADQARDIASYIETTDENTIYLDIPAQERQFYAETKQLHQYLVRKKDGEILFTSPVAYTDLFPENKPESTDKSFFEFTGKEGMSFIGGMIEHEHKGQKYIVQVAQSEESANTFSNILLQDFLQRLLVFGIPFMLVLIAVIYWSIRQSLKPVRIASEKAEAISFKRMDMRLPESHMPSEIKSLLHAVNSAFSRLEYGVQSQREFTANAAHELRTPLSILRSHVDSLENGETVQRLRQDIDAMTRLTTQLLDMSRLDFPETLPMEKIRLDQIINQVCRDFWPFFIDAQKELQTEGLDQKSEILGNQDAVYRAIRNLLENALTHSPAKTPVKIELEDRKIKVKDYGNPISVSEQKKIFERFQRAKHSGPSGGAGLGLSIVKRTMDLHGGNVHYETSEKGNAFILEFPDTTKTHDIINE